jgi:hypothetical protein
LYADPNPRGAPVLFHDRFFNHNEGGLNLLAIDDARPVAAWSHYHAAYAIRELRLLAAREQAIQWALDGLRARNDVGQVQAYEAQLAEVQARQAAHRAQCERLEAARVRHPFAPRESPFAHILGGAAADG